MWRIKHSGLKLQDVLIMAYMNLLEASRNCHWPIATDVEFAQKVRRASSSI